jgi:anti-anti-sigma factor
MSDDRQLYDSAFSIEPRESGLALTGELDAVTLPALLEAFAAQNGRPDVLLELSELSFIDSSGIHAIVTFARSRQNIGTVTLSGVSPFLLKVLEITRVRDVPNLAIRERA